MTLVKMPVQYKCTRCNHIMTGKRNVCPACNDGKIESGKKIKKISDIILPKDVMVYIFEILREMLGISPETIIILDAELIKDLKVDSLDFVEIIMAIEEKFDIEIDDDVAMNCVTVQDILNIVMGDINAKNSSTR